VDESVQASCLHRPYELKLLLQRACCGNDFSHRHYSFENLVPIDKILQAYLHLCAGLFVTARPKLETAGKNTWAHSL